MSTWGWISKNVLMAIAMWFTAIILISFVVFATPGNPLEIMITQLVSQGYPYFEALTIVRSYFGIDVEQPIYVKVANYLANLVRGDLGKSISYRVSVSALIANTLPWSVFFVSYALLITMAIGVTLGLILAYYRGKAVISKLVTFILSILNAVPNWVMGVILFVYVGYMWRLLPYMGPYDAQRVKPGFSIEFIVNVLYYYLLPVIALVLTSLPRWAWSVSSIAIMTLKDDYITYAKARGLTTRRILFNYVARNSLLPTYATISVTFAQLLIGTVWLENLYSKPGIGTLLSVAIGSRDYPVILGVYATFVGVLVLANLLTDMTYGLIDPRARIRAD
ncbi:MAG: ABC transporter permease [Ignisphaera sp.]|uniref:ABC transporter permease n=1 Tax=Ignisphaera aggregans TaxID=334771 RepID=A0A7C4JJ44_9CREN